MHRPIRGVMIRQNQKLKPPNDGEHGVMCWNQSRWAFSSLLLIVVLTLQQAPAETTVPVGPSFRIETEIYHEPSGTPVSRHKILFHSGVVYDLFEKGGSVNTVFDPFRQRVILLHSQQEVQAEIPTQHLIDVTAQLSVAAQQHDRAASFGLEAEVAEAEDRFSVQFGACRYDVTTQPVTNPEIAIAFHDFSVWAARMNVLHRRGVPPFGRMKLGESIASAGRLPLDLVLTIEEGRNKQSYRAHHLLIERLGDLDRQAIQRIGSQMANFRKVDLEDFPMDD